MSVLDEAAAELLATVITVAGRRLRLALASPRGRKRADIDLARWLDASALSDLALPALSGGLPDEEVAEFLHGNAIQAILHELLAARLTDAPEAEVERLSGLFTASGDGFLSEKDLAVIFGFFDKQICGLVGRLRDADSELLHRIRQEAYLARVVAAIDRHTALTAGRPDPVGDHDFVVRYRRHAAEYHGRLQPPDFERRRLVPIDDLYVSPAITHLVDAAPGIPLAQTDIWQLDDEIDRAVLLGDPGGGKTTASNVLMHRHAADTGRPVPFLVVLREYAADDPPERSVLHHIEHKLKTFYQAASPAGLVESLLVSGSALVIFDGLDELLNTSARSQVAAIIEQFCAEYPLSRVLVTSRIVGYDQARLDDRQFECYQISGFDAGQITNFVQKWFACQSGVDPGEADSFMQESAGADDLRSNPLMLALMCILYRGEGSIPRSRPEVYEKCAALLFHKWDASRKIHAALRARNLIEPVLRYLAHWLLTRADAQPAVTERELVSQTTGYLLSRGFEQHADAEAAALEFVEFCRGRLWVFAAVGTTGRGEPLYSFTHRTFLEYFAAAYIASIHDSPEQLARKLAGRLAKSEWDTVAQLAIQIKDHASERGADRIFQTLLAAARRHRTAEAAGNILGFLGRCTAFAELAPITIRDLAARTFAHALTDTADEQLVTPLAWLMVSAQGDLRNHVASELEARVAALVESGNSRDHILGLRLALQLHNAPFAIKRYDEAWNGWNISSRYERQLMLAADVADDIAVVMCLNYGRAESILARRSDLPHFLFMAPSAGFLEISWISLANRALCNLPHQALVNNSALDYVGRMLKADSPPPYISTDNYDRVFWDSPDEPISFEIGDGQVAPDIYRSAAYILCVFAEFSEGTSYLIPAHLGALALLHPYLIRRWGISSEELMPLPVDEQWQEIFIRWSHKNVDFTLKPARLPDA